MISTDGWKLKRSNERSLSIQRKLYQISIYMTYTNSAENAQSRERLIELSHFLGEVSQKALCKRVALDFVDEQLNYY
jgi:hypothetical protein